MGGDGMTDMVDEDEHRPAAEYAASLRTRKPGLASAPDGQAVDPVAARPMSEATSDADDRPAVSARSSRGTSVVRRVTGSAVAIIAALAVLGAALGAGVYWYALIRPTTYTAEALLVVLPNDPAVDASVAIAGVWVQVGAARTVMDAVADSLGVDSSEVQAVTSVSQPKGVPLVSIQVVADDAETSARTANAVAAGLLQQSNQFPVAGYRLQQVTQARPAAEPDPSSGVSAAVGAGLLGGLAGGLLGRSLTRRRGHTLRH